jgi:hypothetical protein
MTPERIAQARWKRFSIAHAQIPLDVSDPPHTRNHRAHSRMFQNKT